MRRYNLLIIDDDWKTRESSYRELFGSYYNLQFLKDPQKDSFLIRESSVDAVILDLDLTKFSMGLNDGQKPNPSNFELFLQRINSSKPVILTSSKFNELATWVNKTRQYNVQVIDMFGWEEVFNSSNNLLQSPDAFSLLNRIDFNLDEYYKRTHSKKAPNDLVNILHISDMQYGDPNYSVDNFLNDLDLAHYLNEHEINVDFIAITGDIAYSGLPSEYHEALKWINNFCKNIYPRGMNYQDRILLVPGNHDVNVYMTAADIYTYDFSAKSRIDKLNQTDASENILFVKPRTINLNNQHRNFGLLPFREFAFRLTGDSNWFHQYADDELCWCNDKFLNWGIRFIHLNTVTDLTYNDPKYSGVRAEVLEQFARKTISKSTVENVKNSEIYTIYLTHNDPFDMGYSIDGGDINKTVLDLFKFINRVGGDLYLHGHRHMATNNFEYIHQPGQFTEDLAYVLASTLTLNQKVRQAEKRRGFNIIQLNRTNSVVESATLRTFEIHDGGIDEKISKKPRIHTKA